MGPSPICEAYLLLFSMLVKSSLHFIDKKGEVFILVPRGHDRAQFCWQPPLKYEPKEAGLKGSIDMKLVYIVKPSQGDLFFRQNKILQKNYY